MEALKGLGLSEYEAKIYSAMLRIGASGAKRISKESGVPPTACYPNLRSLEAKGLIQAISGEVTLFEALDPRLALRSFSERQKISIDQQYDSAMHEVSQIQSKKLPGEKSEPIKISTGFEISAQWFLDMSARAEKEIFVMGWKLDSKRSKIKLMKALSSMTQKRRDVRVITNSPNYTTNPAIRELKSMGLQVRYREFNNFSIIVRDGIEAKITLKNPTLGDRLNLQIEDRDLSSALREYFLATWNKSRKV